MHLCGALLCAAALILISSTGSAQSLLRLQIANDTFMQLDRWESSRLTLDGTIRLTPDLHARVAVGQVMYTPRNIQFVDPPERDRAFAGWLYADLGAIFVRRRARTSHLVSGMLRIGVIGPAAGAEPIQDATHQILGVRRPQGWSNQLPNQLGYFLRGAYVLQHAIDVDGLSLVVGGGALLDVGNTRGRGRAGVSAALTSGIEAAGEFFDSTLQTPQFCPEHCVAFYGTAYVDGVWHDRFIDATGAATRPAIEARTFVAGVRGGWIYQRRRFWTSVNFVIRMRQFDNVPAQRLHPRTHAFATLSVGAILGAEHRESSGRAR